MCPTSQFFDKACGEQFQVVSSQESGEDSIILTVVQEGQQRLVILREEHPEIIARMIIYQYAKILPVYGNYDEVVREALDSLVPGLPLSYGVDTPEIASREAISESASQTYLQLRESILQA